MEETKEALCLLFEHHKNRISKKLSQKSVTQQRLRRWCQFLPHDNHLSQTIGLILEHSILACYSQGISPKESVEAAFTTLGIPEDLINFYIVNGL
jgi:hypothetical protein